MPESIGYITELIADYCYKGLSHNVLGSAGVNLFTSVLYLTLMRSFVVCHGDILTVVIVRHFSL